MKLDVSPAREVRAPECARSALKSLSRKADETTVEDLIVFESAATFLLSAALATYVALQRPRSNLHAAVLVLLLTFMAWSSGLILLHGSYYAAVPARAGALKNQK